MSILKYRALLKTLECRSLTQAAEQLGYTQPGISHMILSLEQEMGFPLLIRSREGVTPTAELNEILIYLRQIITAADKLQETIDKINGIETGNVRVGAFHSISLQWLPEIVHHFSGQHPQIQLQLFEGDQGELTHWLLDGRIDCALMSAPAPEGFEFCTLRKDPVMAVLPDSHPLAGKEKVCPGELVKYPFIFPYEGSDEDTLRVLKGEKLSPKIKFRIKGDETILSMVSHNLGVSLMPELLLRRLPEHVVIRPLSTPYARCLGLAVRSRRYASPATVKFMEAVQDYLNPRS
ncbi:MAG: LysR family transcriptional regulator [Lachnospiraceae bacterium]|nr:LysR family transcriptional regulator [Lachnospiraceae bacterium]